MRVTKGILVFLAANVAAAACWADPQLPRFSANNIDHSADACEDFYQYACGNWIKSNPRPADESWWGTWEALQRRNDWLLAQIIQRASVLTPARSANQRLIGDYYAACMNEPALELEGLGAIAGELRRIDALQNQREFAAELARLHRMLYLAVQGSIFPSWADPGSREAVFGLYSAPDFHDSRRVIAFIDQGGLALGDRNYYIQSDVATRLVRTRYLAHVAAVFSLTSASVPARESASRVLAIESALARASMPTAARIDKNNLAHSFDLEQLEKLAPTFAWREYLKTLAIPTSTSYVVANPPFLQEVDRLLGTVSLADWKQYLRWHLLNAVAPMLGKSIRSEDFEFNRHFMRGAAQPLPRSTSCLRAIDRDLPDALGQEFVAATLRPEDMRRVSAMAQAVHASLQQEVAANDWLADTTRAEALGKVKALRLRIAVPEHWQNYATLPISRIGWAKNAFAASADAFDRQLRQLGGPPDTNEWWNTPTTVDAYHNPSQLTISIPAATLAPPFYDAGADDAFNFGAIGALFIGHEMSHAVDTMGRHYDHQGNLVDWWTPKDAQSFNVRAKCISDQYSNFTVVDDLKINGEQTSAENIADATGLRAALLAFHQQHADPTKLAARIEGFSPDQRLFLGYANMWCESVTPEVARDLVSGDRHAPGKFRLNGVVSNMPEFQQAFACKRGQAMVHRPACRVW